MIASFEAVTYTLLPFRPLQLNLLASWEKQTPLLDCPMCLSSRVRFSLAWQISSATLEFEEEKVSLSWKVFITDGSLLDWGAALNSLSVQGTCSLGEAQHPIYILELGSIRLSLQTWITMLQGPAMKIQSNYASALPYVYHQGSTRSLAALKEANVVLSWASLGQNL